MGLLRRLLPTGRAWEAAPETTLGKLIDSVQTTIDTSISAFADTFYDAFPESTTQLDRYEFEEGLAPGVGTDAARRTRLAGRLATRGVTTEIGGVATSGTSAADLTEILHQSGFPQLRVLDTYHTDMVRTTEAYPDATELSIWTLIEFPLTQFIEGYIMADRRPTAYPNYTMLSGAPAAYSGHVQALAGNFTDFVIKYQRQPIPQVQIWDIVGGPLEPLYRRGIVVTAALSEGLPRDGQAILIDPALQDDLELTILAARPAQTVVFFNVRYA